MIKTAARLALAATMLLAAGCGGDPPASGNHGGHHESGHSPGGHHAGSQDTGHGLTDTRHGYRLAGLAGPSRPGEKATLSFHIASPGGKPQTRFRIEQTKKIHVYVVRKDLAHFQHVHPNMAGDGTWTVPLALTEPGPYRVVTEFVAEAGDGTARHLVLGADLTVPGAYQSQTLPAPNPTGRADGYDLTLTGTPAAGDASRLSVRVTRDGHDVTDLQPYLDAHAHITGFHKDTLAVTHLHPTGKADGPGGPQLNVTATFPRPGKYRLFIQFQTSGTVHTAPVTVNVD
ncbi:MAG: hypothetical protein ACRDTM_12460 [Micromonosporaceae bacterium]